jgi:hypothetical protein
MMWFTVWRNRQSQEDMMKGILGKKVGMTQLFDEKGVVVPVTVIEAGPCFVTQVKTVETDGYNAIQLGFEEVAERKLTKAQPFDNCARCVPTMSPNIPRAILSRPTSSKTAKLSTSLASPKGEGLPVRSSVTAFGAVPRPTASLTGTALLARAARAQRPATPFLAHGRPAIWATPR